MICVNIPSSSYTRSSKAPRNHYYIRVFEKEADGIITCWEDYIDHRPTAADYTHTQEKCINELKKYILKAIEAHDKSEAVNEFTLLGHNGWLHKDERVTIKSSLVDELAQGRTHTTIFLKQLPVEIEISAAQEFLQKVEVYAKDCLLRTMTHIANVNALETPDEILAYDYTTGYPEKVVYSI